MKILKEMKEILTIWLRSMKNLVLRKINFWTWKKTTANPMQKFLKQKNCNHVMVYQPVEEDTNIPQAYLYCDNCDYYTFDIPDHDYEEEYDEKHHTLDVTENNPR